MAILSNHYEAAFDGFLRGNGVPFVPVDESRRLILKQASLKSLDFIVRSPDHGQLLIDVKGRQFPTGSRQFPTGRRQSPAGGRQFPTGSCQFPAGGCQFPAGGCQGGRRWENWVTEDDTRSMLKWEEIFGADSLALFVFSYELRLPRYERDHEELFEYRGNKYAFYGVPVAEYRSVMRQRSGSWETVGVPSRAFSQLRQPIRRFL
ncbi:HYExAFE family protein [Calycomorphotria hydatis]|uniref:Uncharacterized protein n=1 Tax=Calycomorphotria hydatis TaxID=2528027 RepID=A0A517T776_9PLAN|nr:HYExAFE family protein [Calycomorphotria hydatis]QDT64219.1 hypothetical protein V22_14500 [Calycomorphotria hydatis]